MANPEHLAVLERGMRYWNRWVLEEVVSPIDLSDAQLEGYDLQGFRFYWVDLKRANLSRCTLSSAVFWECGLDEVDLQGAYMHWNDIGILEGATIDNCSVNGLNISEATLGSTLWLDVDLRRVQGIDACKHEGPSVVDHQTLRKSRGQISSHFLRACGLSEWEIEAARLYDPNLSGEEVTSIVYTIEQLRGDQPLQINPVFISYSHSDQYFIQAVERKLDEEGVRYWRDVHDLRAGRLEPQIDRALRLNPTVLLVLSKRSVESDWVEYEATEARKLEKQLGRDVLCPVALDDAWKTCSWSGPLRRQIEDYNILDFSDWEDEKVMERQFEKLLDGLGLFYRGEGS